MATIEQDQRMASAEQQQQQQQQQQQPGTDSGTGNNNGNDNVSGSGNGSGNGNGNSSGSGSGSPQQFCLRWNNYQTNLTNVFDQLLQSESFVDVTLACDGNSVKAHKMVLSACSPYFQTLFFDNPCQHPIVIMKDIKWPELKAAVEFMYKGEINVSQEQIGPLLKVAESLKIRGLADVGSEHDLTKSSEDSLTALASSQLSVEQRHRHHHQQQQAQREREQQQREQQQRKRRRMAGSAERSPASASPDRAPSEERDSSASTGGPESLHGLGPGPASTPRSLGSPGMPSLSVTPQISLQELPLGLSGGGPGTPLGQQLGSHGPLQLVGHHPVHPGPPPGVNHLGAHTVAQQIQVAQQHRQEQLLPPNLADDLEIKPGIAEMIREEERAKLLESSHAWLGASTSSIADSYQYQLQSMWQKCWNTNQSLVHNLRFRERGPLKSWRPETMAEAIFSVLKEGLSLSQAARKYDIPYPTFVLYANRVHNMLGPSADGGADCMIADLRPKGRGRPQRILLGVWPDEHIRGVIRAVVFRDGHSPHMVKEESTPLYPSLANYGACNGPEGAVSPSAAAAAVAAVAQGLRHQMCSMVAAAHSQQQDMLATNLSSSLSSNLSSNLQAAMQQASQQQAAAHHHQQQQQHLHHHHHHQGGPPHHHSQHPLQHPHQHHNNSGSGGAGPGPASTPVSHADSPLNLGLGSPGSGGAPESPLESPLASPLGSLMDAPAAHLPPSVEVGIGVSGMAYKPVRSFVGPPENLFQEDISELVKSSHAALKEKDKIAVKLEPLADSRCE